MAFIDLEKAYDRVPRDEIWRSMREQCVSEKYVRLVKEMYRGAMTQARSSVGMTKEFPVKVGLHQGSALSPYLFDKIMGVLVKDVKKEAPWNMMFAEAVVLCEQSIDRLEEKLEDWRKALEGRGMKISRTKSEYLALKDVQMRSRKIQDDELKSVCKFKYQGSYIQRDGGLESDIRHRINCAYKSLQRRRPKYGLKEEVVLITGASSGLGEVLAHAFYRAGCRVVLAARREDELRRVKNMLLTTHSTDVTHPSVVFPLDLSDLNALPGKVAKVLEIFGVYILINNGGISYRGNILTTSIDIDVKLMLINAFGQMALTKAVLPFWIDRQSGHILSVSSVQGKIAIPYRSAYIASKHAVQAFSDTLRAEAAAHNINVAVVSSGYIHTKLSVNALTGNGEACGVTDSATENGSPVEKVVKDILYAVATEKKELTICSFVAHISVLLRTLYPELFFWLMKKKSSSTLGRTSYLFAPSV
ncbi:dehydrogenase/reductase SDR family protein 7-like [Schistocerca americana]|uniref:dehydrogenase/reductase SDR family protein 7-like n=1 Tax=Schistocerca americana TaxID=7009 RepID=UPI001F4F9B3B|nr:dehydrogenase/reductase SDR family protein 7-like [Schistocerca americana]